MKQVLLAPSLVSSLNTASDEYQKNRADMLEQLDVIDDLLDQALANFADVWGSGDLAWVVAPSNGLPYLFRYSRSMTMPWAGPWNVLT